MIDQTNAYSGSENLVGNNDCECNYSLQGDDRTWDEWVQQWMNGDPQGSDIYPWFYRYDGGHDATGNPVGNFVQAPSWAVDVAACWVNNIRDMINLQNAIYFTRDTWNNNMVPYRDLTDDSGFTEGIYWGWNEVPVSAAVDTDPSLVTTYVISLPPGNCAAVDPGGYQDSIYCFSQEAQQSLECQITTAVMQYDSAQYYGLNPGADNAGERAGSYILFLKNEAVNDDLGEGKYESVFYCEEWTSPNGIWNIVYSPEDNSIGYGGACYLDFGANFPTDAEEVYNTYYPTGCE